MKKKIFAIILSAVMAAGQFSCVYGAEFSSGEENTGFEEQEAVFPEEESVFSSGEAEDTEDISETELFSSQNMETDIFAEDESMNVNDSLAVSNPEDAQEMVPGSEYLVDLNGEGTDCWYKYTPATTGEYVAFSNIDTGDYTIELYKEDGDTLIDYSYGPGFLDILMKQELIEGKTYYYRIIKECEENSVFKLGIMESDNYFSMMREKIHNLVLNGQYTIRLTEEEPDCWFRYIPDETGEYGITARNNECLLSGFTLYSEDDFGGVSSMGVEKLTKGKTYYYHFSKYEYDTAETVVVTFAMAGKIKSIELSENEAHPAIYWYGWDGLTKNDILRRIQWEITYADGSSEEVYGYSAYTDNFINDSYGNQFFLEMALAGSNNFSIESLPVGKCQLRVSCGDIKSNIIVIEIGKKDLTKLPVLREAEKGSIITKIAADTNSYSYAKFIPRRTGFYEIYVDGVKDGYISLYNTEFKEISPRNDYEKEISSWLLYSPYYLEAGKTYYISGNGLVGGPGLTTWDKSADFYVELVKDMTPSVSLTKCKAALSSTSLAYTGKALTPSVKVTYGNQTLVKDKDYTVSYSNNVNLGTGKATIKGKGNYTGTITRTFKIILGTPKLKNAASAGYNKIKITWNAVPGAKSYTLYYKGGSIKSWKIVKGGITGTNYTHTSSKSCPLVTGTKYTYTVKAVNGNIASAYDKKGKTAAPTLSGVNIEKVTSAGYNKLKITWKKRAGASGYIIERKSGNKWTKVYTAKASATSYVHTASKTFPIKLGTTYSYRIKAYRKVNGKTIYSGYSDVAKGKTALAKPVIKAGTSSNGITLSWKKVSGAQGYIVYRYDGEKLVEKGSTKKLSYTDKTAKKGKTYKYRVKAYCKVGGKVISSALSSAKSAKR